MLNIKTIGLAAVGAVAIGLGCSVTPAEALTFDNTGIQFDTDTTVTFQFQGGGGGFVDSGYDSFGVVENPLNNPTTLFPGTSATGATTTFNFKANQLYSLFLDVSYPGPPGSGLPFTAYSTNSLNPNGVQQALFIGNDIFSGVTISWEDLPVNTFGSPAFGDYVVKATATPSTPIPTPALLPGLLGLGAAALRKHKQELSEQVTETVEV